MKHLESSIEGIEITTFRLKDCSFENFIAANADIDTWLKLQKGFRSRHIAEKQDHTIVDMLLWDSTEAATQAMHRLMDEMAHSPVHGMIDQKTVSWNVYPVYHQIKMQQ